ncbi:MAG TPA: hypothetical protein VNL34_01795 [Candidatus Nitrosotenuis sp.]|nr:hypothetical protein [Candidatus Nitrosotenuis sp.]
MIPLEPNEKVRKAFEVNSSPHGKGILYVTTLGIAFESQKYGLVLDVSFEWMQSYDAKKSNKLQLVWDTPQGKRASYLFGVDSAREAYNIYSSANKDYAISISEHDALKIRLEKNLAKLLSHHLIFQENQKETWVV